MKNLEDYSAKPVLSSQLPDRTAHGAVWGKYDRLRIKTYHTLKVLSTDASDRPYQTELSALRGKEYLRCHHVCVFCPYRFDRYGSALACCWPLLRCCWGALEPGEGAASEVRVELHWQNLRDKEHKYTILSYRILTIVYTHGSSKGTWSVLSSEVVFMPRPLANHLKISHLREAFPVAGCRSWPCRRVWRTGSVRSFARWCSVASAAAGAAPRIGPGSRTACRWCSPPGLPGPGIASAWFFQGHSDLWRLWDE